MRISVVCSFTVHRFYDTKVYFLRVWIKRTYFHTLTKVFTLVLNAWWAFGFSSHRHLWRWQRQPSSPDVPTCLAPPNPTTIPTTPAPATYTNPWACLCMPPTTLIHVPPPWWCAWIRHTSKYGLEQFPLLNFTFCHCYLRQR